MITYVAIEGIEGAGKSTVAKRVVNHLGEAGHEVVAVREPGGTETGERIRAVLLDPAGHVEAWSEALLFAAARAQLAAEVVGPALSRGAVVISDRSVYSSLAYQGAGRGLGLEAVRAVNEPGLEGVWPQRVVLLRIDPTVGLDRQHDPDRIGSEGVSFQQTVAAAFDDLATLEPERFVVVDAAGPLDDVVSEVLERLGWP